MIPIHGAGSSWLASLALPGSSTKLQIKLWLILEMSSVVFASRLLAFRHTPLLSYVALSSCKSSDTSLQVSPTEIQWDLLWIGWNCAVNFLVSHPMQQFLLSFFRQGKSLTTSLRAQSYSCLFISPMELTPKKLRIGLQPKPPPLKIWVKQCVHVINFFS